MEFSIEVKHYFMMAMIILQAFQDGCDFCVDRGNGWLSVNKFKYYWTFIFKWDLDGWHTFRKLLMTAAGLGAFGLTWHFLIYAVYNFFLHNLFLHWIVKPIFIKYNRRKRS